MSSRVKLTLPPPDFASRCFLLLPPAFLIALKYDVPHVLLLTAVLLTVPFFIRKPAESSTFILLIGIPAALVLAFVPNYMFEPAGERITQGDALLRSHLFVPLLLYATSFMCMMNRSRERTAFIAMLGVFSLLVCGDILNAKALTNIRFPGTTTLLHSYMNCYTVCAICQALGVILLLTMDARIASRKTDTPRERRTARLLRALFLAAVPLILFAEADFYAAHSRDAKQLERYLLSHMRRRAPIRSSRRSDIRIASNFSRAAQNTGRILLRINAPSAPGYLRGRVCDEYSEGGVWRSSLPADKNGQLTDLAFDKDLAISYFPVRNDAFEPDPHTMEIFFTGGFTADYLPVPGNISGIEMVADKASRSPDGVISTENFSSSAGYIVHTPGGDFFSAAQTPLEYDDGLQRFRNVPPRMRPILHGLCAMLLRDSGGHLADEQTIERIGAFLRTEYRYSLDPDRDSQGPLFPMKNPPREPVLKFLFYTRAGHCELFASAAVLMLRACGIPARYVTGFVCTERHPAGFYYAADFHAHAWAEAYDSQNRRWVPLDPTPASWIENTGGTSFSAPSVRLARLKLSIRQTLSSFVRGYPGKYVSAFLRKTADALLDLITSPGGIAFLILLAGGVTALVILIRGKRDPARVLPPEVRRLRKLMFSLVRRMPGTRAENESWTQWTGRFRAEPYYEKLCQLVRRYEVVRYGVKPVSAAEADDLARKIAAMSPKK